MILENIDTEALARDLNEAIREVLAKYEKANRSITREGLTFRKIGTLQHPYTHKWPKEEETFHAGTFYEVRGQGIPEEGLRVLVARKTRNVWAKSHRPVAVVFGTLQTNEEGRQLTPYVEFLQDDQGTFSSTIPNPLHPREALKSGDSLPSRLVNAPIKRNDELFDSIRQGPALRLVLSESDEPGMIAHGIWVATLKNRF